MNKFVFITQGIKKMSSSEPQTIIIDGDEEIQLDSNGIEIRSDEEEPTQSDIDFIAPDDEVEAEVLLSQTVCEQFEGDIHNEVNDLGEVPPLPTRRLTRQSTVSAYCADCADCDYEDSEDEDYTPEEEDSGDDGDEDDFLSDDDEV